MNRIQCFNGSSPNPLAPPWLFPTEYLTETPDGYRDEYQLYSVTQALTALQVVTVDLDIFTAGECNFYWRLIGCHLFGGAGKPTLRIRDSEGYMMNNSRFALANDAPYGRQDRATPLPVPHRMMPGSRLSLDFAETANAVISVCVYFHGVNRWPNASAMDGRGGANDAVGLVAPLSGGSGLPGTGGL